MKFIALMASRHSTMVMPTESLRANDTVPTRPIGTNTCSSCTPSSTITPEANTWPASLLCESISHRSSTTPSRQMKPPATSTAEVSEPCTYVRCRVGIRWAMSSAAAIPAYIATPPSRGVGIACTSRSRGRATAPHRIATTRTTGVSRNVTAAATQKTSAYSRTGCRASDQPLVLSTPGPGVRGVRLDQCLDAGRHLRGRHAVAVAHRAADEGGDLLHLALSHALGGDRRGTQPDTGGHRRWLRVERDRVLVQRDPGRVGAGLGLLAGHPQLPQVDQGQVGVGAAGDRPHP